MGFFGGGGGVKGTSLLWRCFLPQVAGIRSNLRGTENSVGRVCDGKARRSNDLLLPVGWKLVLRGLVPWEGGWEEETQGGVEGQWDDGGDCHNHEQVFRALHLRMNP